mmetsp:Transcript_5137/g.7611  ORF Transcript_5137/g.7611 Transcript_5137/m.7611 type:complete len:82 (+) Transcript_5137:46-291(+)
MTNNRHRGRDQTVELKEAWARVYPDMMQTVMEKCFKQCVFRFYNVQLAPSEVNCVKNCTSKWIDAKRLVEWEIDSRDKKAH